MPFPAGSSLSTPNSPLSSKGGNILSHQIKDIDYLSISTRIRAMENRLLTRERMDRMIGFKRAGAKMIITYHALDVARWLKEEQKEQ